MAPVPTFFDPVFEVPQPINRRVSEPNFSLHLGEVGNAVKEMIEMQHKRHGLKFHESADGLSAAQKKCMSKTGLKA